MAESWYTLLNSDPRLAHLCDELSEALCNTGYLCEDIASGEVAPVELVSQMETKQMLPVVNLAEKNRLLACLKKLAGDVKKTITILDPDGPYPRRVVTLKDEKEFDRWASLNSLAGIVPEENAPETINYTSLEDGGTYIARGTGVRATLERLDGAARHLTNRREDEAAKALVTYFQSKGASDIENHPELRVVTDSRGNHIAEVDGVLFVDGRCVVLSHKNNVADDSEVRQLLDTISTKLQQNPRLEGRTIVPAFMAESIKQGREQKVRDTCRKAGVLLLSRNGSAVSVECRAGQGTCSRRAPSRLQLLRTVSWRQRCMVPPRHSMQHTVVPF